MTIMLRFAAAILAALALAGCASVPVRKVPTPTQYSLWTDQMQRQADAMKGIRFYLPRPFINVFESFPVRTDVALADGFVSADGKYVVIDRVRGSGPLAAAFNDHREIKLPTEVLIPARSGAATPQGDGSGTPGAGGAPAPEKSTATVIPAEPATPAPEAPTPAPAVPVLTGQARRAVTNDNSAFAYLPLRGNMDIVYLPDFEEQYVVDSVSGLGNAQFSLNLGQGWSLQGFNSLADNSELNRRLFELVDTATRIAKSAADAASGRLLPLISQAAAAGQRSPLVTQGSVEKFTAPPATPVSLKIVQVYYAAKGLYPVIKPRELAERTVVQPAAVNIPLWGSTSNLQASLAAAQAAEDSSRFTVPRYPYQYISFNTFSYLAIEVIKTDAAPFGTLYNATGTEGASGSRTDEQLLNLLRGLVSDGQQPGVLRNSNAGGGSARGGNAGDGGTASAVTQDELNSFFSTGVRRVPGTGERFYTLQSATVEENAVKAALAISPAGKPDTNEVQARDAFQASLEAQFKGRTVPRLQLTNLLGDPADVASINEEIVKSVRFPEKAADGKPHYEIASIFVDKTEKGVRATVEFRPKDGTPPGTDAEIEKVLRSQVDMRLAAEFDGAKIVDWVPRKLP